MTKKCIFSLPGYKIAAFAPKNRTFSSKFGLEQGYALGLLCLII